MRYITVALFTISMTAMGWPALVAVAEADPVLTGGARGQLVVRTYNTFGVPSRELGRARATASEILREAALDIVWNDCGKGGCSDGPVAGELIVQIVAAPGHIGLQSLGYSLIDIRERGGSLATILADRIEALAGYARVDSGVLMGRAIAHELTHLLLGNSGHATRGLMRPRWSPDELQADRRRDWILSADERAGIRRGLVARAGRLFAAVSTVSGGCVYPPKPSRPMSAPPSAYPVCGG